MERIVFAVILGMIGLDAEADLGGTRVMVPTRDGVLPSRVMLTTDRSGARAEHPRWEGRTGRRYKKSGGCMRARETTGGRVTDEIAFQDFVLEE